MRNKVVLSVVVVLLVLAMLPSVAFAGRPGANKEPWGGGGSAGMVPSPYWASGVNYSAAQYEVVVGTGRMPTYARANAIAKSYGGTLVRGPFRYSQSSKVWYGWVRVKR